MGKVTLSCAIAVLLLGTAVQADIFELPLDGLPGSYVGDSKEMSFDFGQEFQSVASVSIRISGTFDGGLYQIYDDMGYPAGLASSPGMVSVLEAQNQGFDVVGLELGSSFSGAQSTYLFTPVSAVDLMLPGWGDVSLGIGGVYGFGGSTVIEEPTANITSATLIIDGTPVPEPLTLSVLGAGAVALLRRRR